MAYQLLILALTIFRAFQMFKEGFTTRFVRTIYNDGILFYFLLGFSSVVGAVTLRVLPPAFGVFMVYPTKALHSVLSTRIILNMRQEAQVDVELSADNVSRLLFNVRPIPGN
ncbi:hypothetical protein AMATHDRAFT_70580 [Amanita thiersii Skay4041]|uniref:Uncharacterized protein n=1 Tax=Amanita thiersii Skay4041 TaxID=703135 RepID=A0A2A9NEI9_9AGAR|nr:hypothetical protein AMATHDRAFT_70580 [Amanita thiersii Skay4041]